MVYVIMQVMITHINIGNHQIFSYLTLLLIIKLLIFVLLIYYLLINLLLIRLGYTLSFWKLYLFIYLFIINILHFVLLCTPCVLCT